MSMMRWIEKILPSGIVRPDEYKYDPTRDNVVQEFHELARQNRERIEKLREEQEITVVARSERGNPISDAIFPPHRGTL